MTARRQHAGPQRQRHPRAQGADRQWWAGDGDASGHHSLFHGEAGISKCLNDKVVPITGGCSSIGSELCRQVARYGPRQIVLYEMSELALYTIEQELTHKSLTSRSSA